MHLFLFFLLGVLLAPLLPLLAGLTLGLFGLALGVFKDLVWPRARMANPTVV